MSSSSPGQPPAEEGGRLLVDEPSPGVARLTISNPGKRGALDHAILDGFAATMPQLDVRCVIITGEGSIFSAGYDIGDLPDSVFADEAEATIWLMFLPRPPLRYAQTAVIGATTTLS